MESFLYKIEFQNLDKNIKENKSKLLDISSKLYKKLKLLRCKFLKKHSEIPDEQRMDFHIELIKDPKYSSLERARLIQNKIISLLNVRLYENAIGITVDLSSFNFPDLYESHITIVYLGKNVENKKFYEISMKEIIRNKKKLNF